MVHARSLHQRPARTYVPGVTGARREGTSELASNENPHGPSPAVLAALREALAHSHLYPEHDAGSLGAHLAERWGLTPEHVIVTAGSTALIDLVARTLLEPGASAVASERSFLAYTTAVEATGATLRLAPTRRSAIDLDGVVGAIAADTRLVFLANPNNPTGTAFDRAAFEAFLDRVPDGVLVVLDEAYAEYAAGAMPLPEGASFVRQRRGVLALRTFSKVHALAGLRVGYGLGPPDLIRALAGRAPTFGVSHLAQRAAVAALDDIEHVGRCLALNREGRERLTHGLAALGLSPTPSVANFVHVDLGYPAERVVAGLLLAGVRVRSLAAWGEPHALRITIGRLEDLERALVALKVLL
jgi:histidinol-phosphate aminotransferase